MKRSILGLMYLIQGMRNAGIDVDTRLASIGIKLDAIDPNSIIHDSLEWDIQYVIGKDVAPENGLFIGQHYALAGYGPLLMLLVTSDSIRTAICKGIEYQKLTHLSGELDLITTAAKTSLVYRPSDLNSSIGLLRAQCEVSGTYKFIQDIYKMMGLMAPEIRVELPFSAPQDPQILHQYYNYYGPNLHFGHTCAAFSLDADVLDVKIPSADAITHRVYEVKCQTEIDRLNAEQKKQPLLVQQVHDYLELQQGVIPTMAETAFALNIPERTLRHQLQQHDTSYKKIREQLIKDKALKLMEYKEYSIEMIAELLGYSEPAAFNHAFKRWFGQSPRRYGK
ncbi:helix-turn-helix domain-containing protein [Acinetobacter soli]|uniref:helix-turn-helix domain-containing protein n=1 Tax=Acinetobacter soli TaxID=487316 RepID=UPI00125CA41B|nr:AraC family transcriptional regulator [Acinetobacter soli]